MAMSAATMRSKGMRLRSMASAQPMQPHRTYSEHSQVGVGEKVFHPGK
jgi:hypothetical protein